MSIHVSISLTEFLCRPPSIYGVGLKACSPAAKRLVKAGVADIAVCCGLGERARRPSRTSRSAILKDWHEHVTKSGTSFRGHYTTNPNDAPLKGKSLKMTIYLHCLIPPNSSVVLHLPFYVVLSMLSHNFTHIQVTEAPHGFAPLLVPSFSLSAAKRVWMVIGSWGSSSKSSGSLEHTFSLPLHSNHPWKGTSINYLTGHYPPTLQIDEGSSMPKKSLAVSAQAPAWRKW